MNDIQVCFRHVSSMLQVQVCSGMFQVYVTSSINVMHLCQCFEACKATMLMFQACYVFMLPLRYVKGM